jgi:hypothetical protein
MFKIVLQVDDGASHPSGMEGNWGWGLSLTALTIMVHAIGMALLAFALRWIVHDQVEPRTHFRRHHLLTILIGMIGATGLLLAMLHGIEAALWAVAYLWLGALASPSDAILYSVDSMSTRGAAGLILEHGWRTMGALEAADGMLLYGMSTAFIFATMQAYWPIVTRGRAG